MKYEISAHIPPPAERKDWKDFREAVRALQINECITVPLPVIGRTKTRNSLNCIALSMSKQLNYKFTCRTTSKGLRIWRVK